VTPAQIFTYKSALKEARASFDQATTRLREITAESRTLNEEISKLRRTITALAAMCSESPGFDKLGITDACMEVMETWPSSVSTNEAVELLESMGFDLATQKNAPASVHAVLTRLADKGKITKIVNPENDAVLWRGPQYDPDCDIPF